MFHFTTRECWGLAHEASQQPTEEEYDLNEMIQCDNQSKFQRLSVDGPSDAIRRSTDHKISEDEKLKKIIKSKLAYYGKEHWVSFKFLLGKEKNTDCMKEALAVSKNFKILNEEFGIKKSVALNDFQPDNLEFAVKISQFKKKLFHIAGQLDREETRELITKFQGDGDDLQLELYFEKWIGNKILQENKVDKLRTILLGMKKMSLAKILDDDFHRGLCIIINQKLYTKQHDPRVGTDQDRERLRETFTRIGFDIEVLNNVTHSKLKQSLENLICKIKDSDKCLVVCILAHGRQDEIFCVDDGADRGYPLDSIKNIFNADACRQLAKKPKIFIVQACQGDVTLFESEPPEVVQDEGLADDGARAAPSKSAENHKNVCTFLSSVPGTTSLRDVQNGTFFIRAVCSAIDGKPSCNLNVLPTEVISTVGKMLEGKKTRRSMVPQYTTTVEKPVRFQVVPEKEEEAVKMRLKRVLVHMCAKEIAKRMIMAQSNRSVNVEART